MTVTQRKLQHLPDEIQTVNEPGVQYQCDSCTCDLTHTIRIKCADPICESDEGVDICPACFCAGKEFKQHKRTHAYRVIEINSYPIFTEDWGADEELLLLTGIASQGLGNWKKISEHIGTRTKEEVEDHYISVYINSPKWPLPRMDLRFEVDPEEFQERKRRRIMTMNATQLPPPKSAPVSAPGVHEIATFLPGRLEFEHELDNEAEDLVKDLEFGVCLEYGGDEIIEDTEDPDVRARAKWEEERKGGGGGGIVRPNVGTAPVAPPNGSVNGVNGHHRTRSSGSTEIESTSKSDDPTLANGNISADEDAGDEVMQPPPLETQESLAFKLTMLEMYFQRVERRMESKAVMFDRGLLDYKKMQAADKKRPREDREVIHRLRPFARLQTAEDYEAFTTDILYEYMLRKKIQQLQTWRRLGLTTPADIERYEIESNKRVIQRNPTRDYTSERLQARAGGRQSSGPDARRSSLASFGGDAEDRRSRERDTPISTAGPPIRRQPAPLNLANSPSLHLLTPPEQALCSSLRILPKPYLVIKETLVREYARRGGKLRRREARDLVKIDVNKTSRVWDFLVQTGYLKITTDPAPAPSNQEASANGALVNSAKDAQASISPRPLSLQPGSSTPSQNGSLYNTALQSIPST
ncbi:hypothetical protein AMATHDRAFT_76028 [Amanita thiersii Skay4041]|uniref:Transcriptional adapter 2 n=1 Tax=Amanita thiersii Skay4041 TaxID=703135 RepID=A0A2A9NGM2_9AGAR|nr:hypothetical protein AMATHDRAFT_76028 [Amanita thiersii Skay4041]